MHPSPPLAFLCRACGWKRVTTHPVGDCRMPGLDAFPHCPRCGGEVTTRRATWLEIEMPRLCELLRKLPTLTALVLILALAACGHPERVSELPMTPQPDRSDPPAPAKPGDPPRSVLSGDRLDAARGAREQAAQSQQVPAAAAP